MSTAKRPVQIEEFSLALRDVQDEELYSIKKMLTGYIAKLHKTNAKLEKLAKGEAMDDESDDEDDEWNEVGPEDKELFTEIIAENEVVVRNYHQRIDAVDNELQHRGLTKETSSTENVVEKRAQETTQYGVSTDNDGGDYNAPNSVLL